MARRIKMGLIQTITQGGQLSAHNVRMLKQVFKIALILSLIAWGTLFFYKAALLPSSIYYYAWYYLKASIASTFMLEHIEVDAQLWHKLTGTNLNNSNISINQALIYTEPYADYLIKSLWYYAEQAAWVAGTMFLAILLFFFARGRISAKKQHISGNKILSPWRLALSLKLTRNAAKIKLGHLPLLKNSETQHVLVTGGTGSGKTNCFHHLLPQIRSQGQQAIIIDTTGVFVKRYYRASTDVILNPFDSRSLAWHPWVECKDKFDYDSIAESIIPQMYSENDSYWYTAARTLFSSALVKLERSQKMSELTQWLLFESLSRLSDFVQGTKAAAHIDVNSEKTASSIRSVASSFLGCLELIQDTDKPFSIRNWIHEEKRDSWLFLSCETGQRAALNPLLSCWFSIAMRSLFLLEPNLYRRLWFVVDELPTLHRLKGLESFLSESRKYGGCALLALQSPAQLEALYGPEICRTIFGNCGTKIVFSEQDPEIAKRISKFFGEREIKEYQTGLSYGANDIRDGVNLTLQTRQQPLISPTAIQFLNKNQAFVRLPGNWPITQVKLDIAKF